MTPLLSPCPGMALPRSSGDSLLPKIQLRFAFPALGPAQNQHVEMHFGHGLALTHTRSDCHPATTSQNFSPVRTNEKKNIAPILTVMAEGDLAAMSRRERENGRSRVILRCRIHLGVSKLPGNAVCSLARIAILFLGIAY